MSSSEQFDLFLILLRLKSYLVSLLDHPSIGNDNFDYTEEFLERKYPDRKNEILELLVSNNISCDSEIAFDEKIHTKFKEIIKGKEKGFHLSTILEKLHIENIRESSKEKTIEEFRSLREQKLREIVSALLQLARIWSQRSELEEFVDHFSILEEEELIRPYEAEELGKLDKDTSKSFNAITKLTELYLEQLTDYYFKYGGDIELVDFIKDLNKVKKLFQEKYNELFNKSGLNSKKM